MLKLFVLLFSVHPVMKLPVAIGTNGTHPAGVVRFAVRQPPSVVRFQVGVPSSLLNGAGLPQDSQVPSARAKTYTRTAALLRW